MWKGKATITTKSASIEQLWATITDVKHWNVWDKDIEWTRVEEDVKMGTTFYLKPKDGPKTRLNVIEMDAPFCFADIAHLPLAKMKTRHVFTSVSEGVQIEIEVEVKGLLSFLWSKIIAQNQIKGAEAQTLHLIEYASSK